jgi:hypothetical protein
VNEEEDRWLLYGGGGICIPGAAGSVGERSARFDVTKLGSAFAALPAMARCSRLHCLYCGSAATVLVDA